MKSYSHIISKLFNEPLLLTPMRHAALLQTLELCLGAQLADVPDPNDATKKDLVIGGTPYADTITVSPDPDPTMIDVKVNNGATTPFSLATAQIMASQ